ncbi:hypothetical protein A3A09_00095 [Candidatus Nomurabacteria bacterium RIFCSPLOWO2_01_FULL_42_20]|uniref:Uncharacterized protein n=1 Tax=Candidatus Nomurabacteria bacterium RIFCSPHIGHO2_01_FULL_42_16 TaxID=1801743 RepID=A0A1F6VIP1_9BACT|nr:MAG: hypothetical protein A2824_03445 [Candidatus Nomurabacteria bacterium RIFCSPHIGHO2_01_FULL_42_16]OGI91201.1 MAG: hypothetical protein A3A09_00095 [Candidatus Nomurabacteria bacterium RIFCSPLOWO2_01_FULL_42_20]
METKSKEIPQEDLNDYIKGNLGYGIEGLLGEKKAQTLKNELSAVIYVVPEFHYKVEVPVVLDAGTEIVMGIPGENIENDFQFILRSNCIEFQLKNLTFKGVPGSSHFRARLRDVVAALK